MRSRCNEKLWSSDFLYKGRDLQKAAKNQAGLHYSLQHATRDRVARELSTRTKVVERATRNEKKRKRDISSLETCSRLNKRRAFM